MCLNARSNRSICCVRDSVVAVNASASLGRNICAVLFDLDGTFADTAPDMAVAVNAMRNRRGMAALSTQAVRPHVSRGARGMLMAGFDMTPEHADYYPMREEFYVTYDAAVCVHTRWFDGMDEVVSALEHRKQPWGIVTNKSARFAMPIARATGIHPRAGCIVCGDTTAHTKPHPAPLLHAANLIGIAPENCLYVGDDERDIIAAHAAGMVSVAAAYGYLGTGNDIADWGAIHRINHPTELLPLLG